MVIVGKLVIDCVNLRLAIQVIYLHVLVVFLAYIALFTRNMLNLIAFLGCCCIHEIGSFRNQLFNRNKSIADKGHQLVRLQGIRILNETYVSRSP